MLNNQQQHDVERRIQLEEGRQMAVAEAEHVTRRRIVIDAKKQPSQAHVGGSFNQDRKKFKAKGHDAVLCGAQDRGAVIEIFTTSGEKVEGVIVARDRYTVSLRDKSGVSFIIYKHYIGMLKVPSKETSANV